MADVKDMDQIVEMCRNAVDDIIASVGGVGNLLQDESRMALIQSIGNRLNQLGADVNAVLGDKLAHAYFQGIMDANGFLESNGKNTSITGFNKQIHLAGIESIASDTMSDMNASFRTATMMAIADIDSILDDVRNEIGKGMILGDSSGVASRRVERAFLKGGMTAFITKDGKRLPLDFYAQTVTRTKYRTAHTTGAVNRYKESGVEHVKINEHHPTCGKCAKYQGKVVALNPDNAQGFPVADIDIPLPPYHPNCQHVARPYVLDYHSETDIRNEKKKWNEFDEDDDPRTQAQKNLYKDEQNIRRKARQEMKEYEMMKAVMPDEVPKTIGAYRRMKRKNDSKWIALQASYRKNADIVTGTSPTDPGTPRKKKGSRTGSSTGKIVATKVKGKPKMNVPMPPPIPKPKSSAVKPKAPAVKPIVPPVPKGPNLTKNDLDAHKEFDKRINNIEFKNRRSTSKHIIDSMGDAGHVKIGIRSKIGANGYVSFGRTPDMKLNVSDFVLLKDDPRPMGYQWKTMFHEYYHLNAHGLDYPPGGLNKAWTRWEETATETSAFFMAKRAGIDVSRLSASYSDHLIETLPRLKQLPEFASANTLDEFGAIFMKYRFDPKYATADWIPLRTQAMAQKGIYDMDKYFADNYRDYVMKDIDKYESMIFDSLTQDNKHIQETGIRSIVRKGLVEGIKTRTVTREIRMILPVLFQEYGVKIP